MLKNNLTICFCALLLTAGAINPVPAIFGRTIAPRELPVSAAAVSGDVNAQREASRQGGEIAVIQNNKRLTFNCRGGNASVAGNKNTITLRGECGQLLVNGNSNIITIETVGEIVVNGNKNRVTRSKGRDGQKPQINAPGSDNVITHSGGA